MEDLQHGCLCQAIDVKKHSLPQWYCLNNTSPEGIPDATVLWGSVCSTHLRGMSAAQCSRCALSRSCMQLRAPSCTVL